jgi:3-oxoadipate enol-lactonase
MWDREFIRYAISHRVVRYDVRGLGRSTPALSAYSDAEDLAALLDDRALRRPTLVGVSNGGSIAIDFALTHPERVERLILSGSALGGYDPAPGTSAAGAAASLDAQMEPILRAWNERRVDAVVEGLMGLWCATRSQTSARRIRRMIRENLAEIVTDASAAHARALVPAAASRLASIACPTLVLDGDRDVELIRHIAREIASKVPGAIHRTLAGADHLANLSRPRHFDAAVLGFLD